MGYSIGQVSRKTGLSEHTLRYYDGQGLLPGIAWTGFGRRCFDDGDLELLDLIECLKSTGMSLAEIKDFVDMTKQGDATLESRLAVFRNQRDVVKRQIAELRRRYIKLDVVITSGASCTSSMKINIPYGSSIFCLVCAECRISKWGFGAKYRISK